MAGAGAAGDKKFKQINKRDADSGAVTFFLKFCYNKTAFVWRFYYMPKKLTPAVVVPTASVGPRLSLWKSLRSLDLQKKQKLALAGVIVVFIVFLLFFAWQMRVNLIYPLYGGADPNEVYQLAAAAQSGSQAGSQEEYQLRHQDTDGDGLSDWDELNVYHTSPFLADTNGDGIDDKLSIQEGIDPVCPQGQICINGVSTSTGTPATTATSTRTDGLSIEQLTALKNQFGANPSAAALRQLFVAAGADSSSLAQIPDDALVTAYQTQVGVDTSTISTSTPATADVLSAAQVSALQKSLGQNPKAAAIRQDLLQAGADPKQLKAISDQSLVNGYKAIIGH